VQQEEQNGTFLDAKWQNRPVSADPQKADTVIYLICLPSVNAAQAQTIN